MSGEDLADVFAYDPAARLWLPASSEQPQQQQQSPAAETQSTPAAGGPVASLLQQHQQQRRQHQQHQQPRAVGSPSGPPPLPPRPPPPLVRISTGNAPVPPASPSWPLLTPASVTENTPSTTAADTTATTTGVDLLSSWNPPTAPTPRSSTPATGAAPLSIEDVAGATSAEERLSAARPPRDTAPVTLAADFAATEPTAAASRASVPPQPPQPPSYPAASAAASHPLRPPPPYPTAALQAVEAAAADFTAASPEAPQSDRRAAVEAAVAGFTAATRGGGESAPHRSHGRLDETSAALAVLRSPTEGRGPPVEDSLTAEEAQAILDAADMAAAEAVVAAAEAAAAEAAEAGAIAALADDLQSPTAAARSPAAEHAVTASPQSPPTLSRHDSVVRAALRQIATAEVAAAAGSTPPSSGAGEVTTASGTSGPYGSAAETGAVRTTNLTEEEEIAAAVAAVAELEARDRLRSSTAGGGGGGGGGPVIRGTPGDEGSVAVIGVSRCALCRSSIEQVVPPAGAPQTKNSSNCRNCWRAVCDNCVGAYWARTMVPPRYTVDSNDYRMRVCKTCDAAMEAFRKALLLGQAEEAMSAYSTGCVNLDRPYTIYHGELPVHCAAAGGNVGLLSWLVDELGCRLFVNFHKKEPVRDLRRLTVLGAAAVNGQVQAMRYLVNQKGCCVSEIAHTPTLKSALDACLHGSEKTRDGERSRYKMETAPGSAANAAGVSISSGAAASMAASAAAADEDDDCCIVCFDSTVDCTLVPCGHHCCCFACAAKVSLCPVCRTPVTQKIKAISV